MTLDEREYMYNRSRRVVHRVLHIAKGAMYLAVVIAAALAVLWLYRNTVLSHYADLHTVAARFRSWASRLSPQGAGSFVVGAGLVLWYAFTGLSRWSKLTWDRYRLRKAEGANRRRWQAHKRDKPTSLKKPGGRS